MADRKEVKITEGLLTASLSPEHKAMALRIVARFGDSFRTRAFEFGSAGANDLRHLEARIDPATGLWTVEEFRPAPPVYTDIDGNLAGAGKKQARQIVPMLTGACLMDALYFCARYEITARDAYDAEAAGESIKALKHNYYRAFAEREGIPFDKKTNLPVIAADGKRLVAGGVLDEDDLAIIKKSEGNLAPDKKPDSAVVTDLSARALITGVPRNLDETIKDIKGTAVTRKDKMLAIQENREKVRGLNKKLKGISEDFKKAVTGGFKKNPVRGIGGMLLWGGFGYLTGWWIVSGVLMGWSAARTAATWYLRDPAANFGREIARLEKSIEKLPEGPLKDHTKTLAADAEIAFYSLYFRTALRQTSIHLSGADKTAEALDLLVAACKKHITNMSVEARDREIAGVLEGLRNNIMDTSLDENLGTALYQRMTKLVSHIEFYETGSVASLAQIPAPQPVKPPPLRPRSKKPKFLP